MNVAIPAILTGCVMVPFCESRIDEMERVLWDSQCLLPMYVLRLNLA